MSDLTDLIATADARDAGTALPSFSSTGGGFDLSSLFSNSTFDVPSFDFGAGTPLVPPVANLPSSGAGMSNLLADITRLISVGYQGEAMVNQQQALNKIAQARLANQLDTVKTTPNIWWVLGAGAAGFFLLEIMDRGKK